MLRNPGCQLGLNSPEPRLLSTQGREWAHLGLFGQTITGTAASEWVDRGGGGGGGGGGYRGKGGGGAEWGMSQCQLVMA